MATIITTNSALCLRTASGCYCSTAPTSANSLNDDGRSSPDPLLSSWHIDCNGQGLGDINESFTLVNPNVGSKEGERIYQGMIVSIKSSRTSTYLGIRENTIGLWRTVVGLNEKWMILKNDYEKDNDLKDDSKRFIHRGDAISLVNLCNVPVFNDENLYFSHIISSSHVKYILTMRERIDGMHFLELWKQNGLPFSENSIFQIDLYGAPSRPNWKQRQLRFSKLMKENNNISNSNQKLKFHVTHFHDSTSKSTNEIHDGDNNSLLLTRNFMMSVCYPFRNDGDFHHLKFGDRKDWCELNDNDDGMFASNKVKKHDSGVQAKELLALVEEVIEVKSFVNIYSKETYTYTFTALSFHMKRILQEFFILISYLEMKSRTLNISMQKLLFLIRPSMRIIKLMHALVMSIKSSNFFHCRSLLHTLQDMHLEQGCSYSKRVIQSLLQEIVRPSLSMICTWIFEGILHDPYNEFMVKKLSRTNSAISSYVVNSLDEEKIPDILRNVSEQILLGGTYTSILKDAIDFTIIFERSTVLDLPLKTSFSYSTINGGLNNISSTILNVFKSSSEALHTIMRTKFKLDSHIASLSRYFLLRHGDFMVEFMNIAGDTLEQNIMDINEEKLNNLLSVALSSSTLANDVNKTCLKCSLTKYSLLEQLQMIQNSGTYTVNDESNLVHTFQNSNSNINNTSNTSRNINSNNNNYNNNNNNWLDQQNHLPSHLRNQTKGIQCVTFDYSIEWPLSFLITPRSVCKYQLLSRLLYSHKYAEAKLLKCWKLQHNNDSHFQSIHGSESTFKLIYTLRHKMLHFLQNFIYYMTLEVIGPRSHELRTGLDNAQSIEGVASLHERFLDTCLRECLISNQHVLLQLMNILTICMLFAEFISDNQGIDTNSEITLKNELLKFKETFEMHVISFLDAFQSDSYKANAQNLCDRLNFNRIYTHP